MNTSKVVTRSTSNVSCRKDSIALGPVTHTQREGGRGREGESERERQRASVCVRVGEREQERERVKEREREKKKARAKSSARARANKRERIREREIERRFERAHVKHSYVIQTSFLCHSHVIYMSHMNELCLVHEWVMSQMNEWGIICDRCISRRTEESVTHALLLMIRVYILTHYSYGDMTHAYMTWLMHMWHDSCICDMTHAYVTWLMTPCLYRVAWSLRMPYLHSSFSAKESYN